MPTRGSGARSAWARTGRCGGGALACSTGTCVCLSVLQEKYGLTHSCREERWAAEGIQIGGPCSARGVLGTWFDKDFDPEGPCGPTSFWKVSDDTQTRLSLTVSRPGGDESSDDEVDEDEDSVMLEAEEEDDSDSEGDGDFVPVVWV